MDILKPTYNICKVAGYSLDRVTNNSTRLKLKYKRMVRLFKEKNHFLSEQINLCASYACADEFILNWFEKKVKKLELITNKIQRTFEKITKKKLI